MPGAKSSCGFYCLREFRNRAQWHCPLRGYEPPGNRPTCAGLIPSSLPGTILPFHRAWEWISYRPCHGKCDHGLCARLAQRARAGIQRRSGRQYVIYQQDAKIVNLTARMGGKSAAHGFPAFFEAKNTLVRPRASAHEEDRLVRKLQALCKGLRNQRGLIVPAFSFALPVKRYGHDYVGGELVRFGLDQLGQALRKPNPERPDLLELQQKDRLDQRAMINREAARAIKGIGFVLASGTEPRPFFILPQS